MTFKGRVARGGHASFPYEKRGQNCNKITISNYYFGKWHVRTDMSPTRNGKELALMDQGEVETT